MYLPFALLRHTDGVAGRVPRRRGTALLVVALIAAVAAACGSAGTQSAQPAGSQPANSRTPSPYNPIYGIDLGLHVLSGKGDHDPVPDAEVTRLLAVLKGRVQWVRLYDIVPPFQNVAKIAHEMGFKVAASVLLNADLSLNQYPINILVDAVNNGYVDYALVGNEEIHVKQLTAAQEVGYIKDVKQRLNGKVPVGTVEPDRELLAHPEVMKACDMVLANIPPISYGVPLEKSLDYIKSEYAQLVAAAGGSEVGIGETEWPSEGFGSSVSQEAKYFADVETWSRAQSVKTFYFEAFDEPWLGQFNAVGPHWGIWTADLQLKAGMASVFAT